MENMQRVELEVEKHGREEERNERNQQAVLVCHALVMTLYNPFGNIFQNYLILKTKNGFININCSLITRFAFLEGSTCKGAVE